jgi:hypothetical protein
MSQIAPAVGTAPARRPRRPVADRRGAILRLDRPQPDHLHWPDLDVDLSVNSIEHPERYPLKAKL